MNLPDKRQPCPGCGVLVHPTALACSECGYRSQISRLNDILSSLVTMSSILTGFGLSSVVQLATVNDRHYWLVQGSAGCWIVAALLLLSVIVGAEISRHRERSSHMDPSEQEDSQHSGQCRLLFSYFMSALIVFAVGVVTIGFYFSNLLGLIGLGAVATSLFVLRRLIVGR